MTGGMHGWRALCCRRPPSRLKLGTGTYLGKGLGDFGTKGFEPWLDSSPTFSRSPVGTQYLNIFIKE